MRIIILSLVFIPFISFGQSSQLKSTLGAGDASKAIEVRGQSRNLNMLLKLQSEREAIDFIKLRKNYRKEIKSQSF